MINLLFQKFYDWLWLYDDFQYDPIPENDIISPLIPFAIPIEEEPQSPQFLLTPDILERTINRTKLKTA